jgi:hypothetical protein
MQSSSRFALRPQDATAGGILNRSGFEIKKLRGDAPDSRRSPGSGEQPSSRCYARGAKSVHEFDWALRADEEALTVVELKLDTLVPAHVVSFPIPPIADAQPPYSPSGL